MQQLFSILLRGAKKYGPQIATLVGTSVLTAILVSHWKDKVYKGLMKKHDMDTAKRLSAEFERKVKDLERRYKDREDELKRKIIDLCEDYDIDASEILK